VASDGGPTQRDESGISEEAATQAAPPPSPALLAQLADPLRPGERVGRYIVLEPVGAGGMGLVWAAFDPTLNRKVALKFLRADGGWRNQARLLREAQALARLSHPNVVAVHDVDTHHGRVFVAMELVVGQSLKAWLREPRSWREVLRALMEAGRGLAAAHRAGIIHRDVKPSNVLVGADGRARVSDFGLARAVEERELAGPAGEPGAEGKSADGSTREDATSDEGYAVGTREYMSPEQAAAKQVDIRTDVFSFCVTAYEALCGVRPRALTPASGEVTGGTPGTPGLPGSPGSHGSPGAPAQVKTWSKVTAGFQLSRLPAPTKGRKPPPRLLRPLVRGLQAAADQRWPSMPPLLEAMERTARPLRPWHVAVAAVLLLGAGSAVASRLTRDTCSTGAAEITAVWSATDRPALEEVFSGAAPDEPDTAVRVAGHLDAYVARWTAAHQDACEAMRRGRQGRRLGALRLACLETRRQEAASLVELLKQADEELVNRSVDAVLGLPGVSACAEVEALTAPIPPPDDGPVRQQIDRLSVQLAQVTAATVAAAPRALGDAEALVVQAEQVGFAPLLAKALLYRGLLYDRAGRPADARDSYLRALTVAEVGHADEVRGWASACLAFSVGHYFGLYAEADRWLQQALAVLERTPARDTEVEARHLLAQIRMEEGRLPEALEALDRMAELVKQRGRTADPDRVRYLAAYSNVLLELGRTEDAVRTMQEALSQTITLRGEQHPSTARVEYLLARVMVEAGRTTEARTHLERAAATWRRSDPRSPNLLHAGDIRATILQVEGRYREALEEARRTQALRTKAGGTDQEVALSYTLANVGLALLGMKRPAEAVPPLERALSMQTRAGLKMSSTAEAMLALARALWQSGGDRARARKLASDAEEATRSAPAGRIHRETVAWLTDHP